MTKPQKTVRFDNYGQVFAPSSAVGRRKQNINMFGGGYLLSQPQLDALYVHNGFARRIVDEPAEEMTRAGFSIEGLDEGLEEIIFSKLEALDVNRKLNLGVKWSRAYGGGLWVLGVKDGAAKLSEPLNETNIQDIDFIRVYNRFETSVALRYSDPMNPLYGTPELWRINGSDANGGYDVHSSRIIVFDGEEVNQLTRVSNDGWGASSLQKCMVQLFSLDNAHKWADKLLERLQQAVHKIPSLGELLDTPQGMELVQKRLQVVDIARNAMNTVAIDAAEEYDVKALSLTGVNEILDRKAEALCSVSNIPVFVFMGRSVGGLNSTGEVNRDAWYARVGSMQNDMLRKPVDRIVSLMIRVQSKGKTDGGNYKIEFNPLSVPNKVQQAEIDYKEAQKLKLRVETFQILVDTSVADQDEMRKEFSEEFDLKGVAPELPEPEPEALPVKTVTE